VAHGLSGIDWSAPWHAPWRPFGQAASAELARGASVAAALNRVQPPACIQGRPRQFVPQSRLPDNRPYEAFIFETACIPTRDGLHDFFNGLVWLALPRAKARLNALHTAHWHGAPAPSARGAARDGLTLLDESGALFIGPDVLWDALCAKDWQCAMVSARALWAQTRIILFGHSLPEKLVCPRKPITAHLYRVQGVGQILAASGPSDEMEAIDAIARIDQALAGQLDAAQLARKPFAHLPLLGIPGWWPANEDPAFYADTTVFRPPRAAT